jgi:FtsH-binding integral membrane protein
MSDFNRGFARPFGTPQADMATDVGLRAFMLGVYNKVALGLALSGVMALITSSKAVAPYLFQVVQTPAGVAVGYTAIGMMLAFAPLVILLGTMFMMRSATPQNSGIMYWSIVSLIGASMGMLLLRYTGQSVASTFFVTAAAFGGLSLWGYTTKRDLSGFGSFLIVGLVGLVVASLVAMFVQSAALVFAISVAGVLIFAGLIAWNTQQLKMTYYQLGGNQAALGVATNFGALQLYLDFVNLFRFLLMFMGNRR